MAYVDISDHQQLASLIAAMSGPAVGYLEDFVVTSVLFGYMQITSFRFPFENNIIESLVVVHS